MGKVTFFEEGIRFRPPDVAGLRKWILSVFSAEGKEAGEINYIFCDDAYLLEINQTYLHHDTLTDIITFDMTEEGETNISADIFVSVERVQDNARQLDLPFERELHRVMVHGILHLVGYGDKTEEEELMMRQKEDEFLNRLIHKPL